MDLMGELRTLIYWIVYQFGMIFPYWALGTVAGSLVSVFLSSRISSLVGRRRSGRLAVLAVIPAALLGAASPICMYGTVPLIASLGRKGVPQHLLAAFMVSSILINPNLFLFSFSLGAAMALGRLAACVLAGVIAGVLVGLLYKNKPLFSFEGFEDRKKKDVGLRSLRRFLNDLNRAVLKTAPYLFAGILLAALFECYFPKNIIAALFGGNKGFGILMAASLGVPVYVCGGGTIPLLKAWLEAGMSPGSAMAFMISGPATKITNLGAVKIILGMRNFILYIAFNMGFAVITGYVVDLIF
jgi:uncharacterized membrane protein YraQ (UPF0718 family)